MATSKLYFKNLMIGLVLLQIQASARAANFPMVTQKGKAVILYDKKAPATDSVTAHLLADDIERVTGAKVPVTTDWEKAKGWVIVIGSIRSDVVGHFISPATSLHKQLLNKWESFGLQVVDKPLKGISQAFLIVGSDTRGTAYGVFTLSEKIGVSPWYWWADVPVKQRKELIVSQQDFVSAPPSVKYRGIFINDEDWGLRPWAANTYEPEKKNIGPKTYAKVFELLLRLKANLLWPAMHPGTEPFYAEPENSKMAELFSIVIGSSHAEPMMRNNVGEWNEKTMGPFNYIANKNRVFSYWEERIKATRSNEVVYTLGMRGVHDSGMEGVKDPKDAVPLLEGIIRDQRGLIEKYTQKEVTTIPQVFTTYKEVLDIYDNGLKLPEDVTIVWPDDNYGYIQRLNTKEEQARAGGSGVYYHASYWGRPHDYLWLSTTHPSLIREEMMKAYENGAHRLWVLNVGDIKPLEYNIQLFMDMAYQSAHFKSSHYTQQHLLEWNKKIFGTENGPGITRILWEYYTLAFERRPEFMGWSQTEPTTKTTYTSYNHFYYGDEASRRIDRYEAIEKAVDILHQQMDARHAAAFYELVYYPVIGAAQMNKKFLYHDKAYLYARQQRLMARDFASRSAEAYKRIAKETEYYNMVLMKGKWKGIMSMTPRSLPVFEAPVFPVINKEKGNTWQILPEGYDSIGATGRFVLPQFTEGCVQRFFIDVFLCDSARVQWKTTPSADWITLSMPKGTLVPEEGKSAVRLWVSIDWKKAPQTEQLQGHIDINDGRRQFAVQVSGIRPAIQKNATSPHFIETNGYVSIYAQHFTGIRNGVNTVWKAEEGLGHTGASMKAYALEVKGPGKAIDTIAIRKSAACLSYTFASLSEAQPQIFLHTLPTHPLNNSFSMRYAVSLDDGPIEILDFRTQGRSEEWKQNVLRNSAVKQYSGTLLKKGNHVFKIFVIDPGVVLDRIMINLGGMKNGYSVVPETRIQYVQNL